MLSAEHILRPRGGELPVVDEPAWDFIAQAFADSGDVDAHVTAMVAASVHCPRVLAEKSVVECVLDSAVAVWALAWACEYELVEISRLGLVKALNKAHCDDERVECVALNEWGWMKVLYWRLSDSLAGLDHAERLLEITALEQWRGADYEVACVVVDAAVESFGSPASEKASGIMRRWEQRLSTAITSQHPDVAYEPLQQLEVWQSTQI